MQDMELTSALNHSERDTSEHDGPLGLDQLVELVTQEPPTQRHALPRVVFVVGATSSGKTALGIRLAKTFDGEVINADARQIYRELSVGTGKPVGKRGKVDGHVAYMVNGVPHHLMDFLPPDKTFTVSEWRDAALRKIKEVMKRGKLPIVVGGTGLYVSSVLDNYQFPKVEPHPEMRAAYDEKSLEELVKLLLAVDPAAANIVDLKNKRRVVRALEVVTFSGRKFSESRTLGAPLVDAFQVGIFHPREELYERVDHAVEQMVDDGLVDEVRTLMRRGLKPDLPSMTSIGYQDVARYLRGEIPLNEAIELMQRRTRQYTKRQWTWFKRDPRIRWFNAEDEAVETVGDWLGE